MTTLNGKIAVVLQDPDIKAIEHVRTILDRVIASLNQPELQVMATPAPEAKKSEPAKEEGQAPEGLKAPKTEGGKKRASYVSADLITLAELWQLLLPDYCQSGQGLEPTVDTVRRFSPERKEVALLSKAEINATYKQMWAALMGVSKGDGLGYIGEFLIVWEAYWTKTYPEQVEFNKFFSGWKALKPHPALMDKLKSMHDRAKEVHTVLEAGLSA